MAQLTEEEAAKLAELQAKQEAPDEPENGAGGGLQRVLNVSVDLGDPAQVERAIGFGFLTAAEAEGDGGDEGDEGEGEGDDGPRRRGFFPDNK